MTRNTFAANPAGYAAARPRYPEALFSWVAARAPGIARAWDCACGNGQAAVGLAAHFEAVHATDVSVEQVTHALPHPRVRYAVAAAESTPFAPATFDAVTVAQALHWFSYDRFWPEVRRIARPGALFCAWGYDWLDCPPHVMDALVTPFREVIGPYWSERNRILWNGYRDADTGFPFDRIEVPAFAIELSWTAGELLAYLRTWSAYQRSREDPARAATIDDLLASVGPLLESPERLPVRMPLKTLAGWVR